MIFPNRNEEEERKRRGGEAGDEDKERRMLLIWYTCDLFVWYVFVCAYICGVCMGYQGRKKGTFTDERR